MKPHERRNVNRIITAIDEGKQKFMSVVARVANGDEVDAGREIARAAKETDRKVHKLRGDIVLKVGRDKQIAQRKQRKLKHKAQHSGHKRKQTPHTNLKHKRQMRKGNG